MLNLFGVYECTADSTGRVMLPGALKKQLTAVIKDGFVIKRSIFTKSLELYPMATWRETSARVNKLNKFVKKNVEFITLFNNGAQPVELDANGRMLIMKELSASVSIKKDIVMAAAVDCIQVWDKKTYEKFIKEKAGSYESLAEEVMGNFNPLDPNLN
jgi:MraZ protein